MYTVYMQLIALKLSYKMSYNKAKMLKPNTNSAMGYGQQESCKRKGKAERIFLLSLYYIEPIDCAYIMDYCLRTHVGKKGDDLGR